MSDSMKKIEETMTKEEFFDWALQQNQPYELIDGHPRSKRLSDDGVTLMAGESPEHSLIQAALITALNNKLKEKGKNCFASIIGVDVTFAAGPNSQGKDRIVYPDATVDCGFKHRVAEKKTATSPVAVFEILSPGNRNFDEGPKLRWYQDSSGVENITYIEQDRIEVRRYTRSPGQWIRHVPSLTKMTDVLDLPALGISLALEEFYGVVFGP